MSRLKPAPRAKAAAAGKRLPGAGAEWLGREIRNLRKRRGLTILDLAAAIGKSTGYVSQVERNRSAPSVADLQKVAAALGVQMGWFFDRGEEGPAEELPFIVRAGRRRKLNFGLGVTDYLLSPSLSGELELLYTTLAPIAKAGSRPSAIAASRRGWCWPASFEISIRETSDSCSAKATAFSVPSTTPDRYRNPGSAETVAVRPSPHPMNSQALPHPSDA